MRDILYVTDKDLSLDAIAQVAEASGFETQRFRRWDACDRTEHNYLNVLFGGKILRQWRNMAGEIQTAVEQDYWQWTEWSDVSDLPEDQRHRLLAQIQPRLLRVAYHIEGLPALCGFIEGLASEYGGIVLYSDESDGVVDARSARELCERS